MMDRPDLEQAGRIFDIQRFSIYDGPGIRTTVFMKGCALRCRWCHNPEGMSADPLLSFLPERCVDCGWCYHVCLEGAHRRVDGQHLLDRGRCRICGSCTVECYASALELVGRTLTVQEVLETVLLDLPFYEASGGGITLSGGEPLQQVEFARALLEGAKAHGLHTTVETCGYGKFDPIERIIEWVDLFLYDIKETDDARHRECTGVSNETILANLFALHERGASIRLRLPIVPGANDREDHFRRVAALVCGLPSLCGVEVLPYHPLGHSKLRRFGRDFTNVPTPTPQQETVMAWKATLTALGVMLVNP